MDAALLEAFKRVENKLKEEKESVLRKEREEQFRLKQERLEKERKKQERIIYTGCVVFLCSIVALIYYANEQQIRASGGVGSWVASGLGSLVERSSYAPKTSFNSPVVSGGENVDCTKPENWRLPVCVFLKKNEVENKWQNMALSRDGKEKAFAIHKGGD